MFQSGKNRRKKGVEKNVARAEKDSEKRIKEEKNQTCQCLRDQRKACRMMHVSEKKLEHTGPAEKERVVSAP